MDTPNRLRECGADQIKATTQEDTRALQESGSGEQAYDVCVIGLGYVGLTLAATLADTGFSVLGVERRQEVVDLTNAGRGHFHEPGLDGLLKEHVASGRLSATTSIAPGVRARVWIITVGTPLNADGRFQTDSISNATDEIVAHLDDGDLVILRSTVAIGTTRGVIEPRLRASGKTFHLAMCPERTLEGRALHELRRLPQIVGADDEVTGQLASRFFMQTTHTVIRVSSFEAAEIIKLVDNTYRDVQFGFANEVARICDAYGVNAMEVIDSGKIGYPRTNVAKPGLVGGPCLEKDPHILSQSVRPQGIELDITTAARRVNERQPDETADFIAAQVLARHETGGPDATVAILGMAFKGIPATDDLRGSMSLKVCAALRARLPAAEIRLYDPVCAPDDLRAAVAGAQVFDRLEAAVAGADCVVIANNHPDFGKIPPVEMTGHMAQGGFIFDYWNHFSDRRPHEIGDRYYGVGNIGKDTI